MNAAGGKEQPIVIGKSEKPRCFKNLENKKCPCNCQYFANSKAWMTSEIMSEVLSKLHRRLQRQKRNILLFMDNAPCHPNSLQDKFENIKIVFLPKNTTSKTQPLDAGIIANWKVYYKKRLLRYIYGKVTSSSSASEIVKSVNLLMAIEWGKQAWDEVSDTTITKCFKKTGLYPDSEDTDEDPFEGEELHDLSLLLDRLDAPCTTQEYIAEEDEVDVRQPLVDSTDPNWRQAVRDHILNDDGVIDIEDTVEDGEGEEGNEEPQIKSLSDAIEHAEQLRGFAQYHGYQELSLAVSTVNDLLYKQKLQMPKCQTYVSDFFKSP